jgi:hypothetical protein
MTSINETIFGCLNYLRILIYVWRDALRYGGRLSEIYFTAYSPDKYTLPNEPCPITWFSVYWRDDLVPITLLIIFFFIEWKDFKMWKLIYLENYLRQKSI